MNTLPCIAPYRELIDGRVILNLHPGQTKAWLSKARFPVILAGCVAGETVIENPFGESKTISELAQEGKDIWVRSLVKGQIRPMMAHAPFLKGIARLYKLTTEHNREIVGTTDHKMLTTEGWLTIGQVVEVIASHVSCHVAVSQLPTSLPFLPHSNWESYQSVHSSNGQSFYQRVRDFQGSCSVCSYPCDAPLLQEADNVLTSSPLPTYVQARNCQKQTDVPAYKGVDTPLSLMPHPPPTPLTSPLSNYEVDEQCQAEPSSGVSSQCHVSVCSQYGQSKTQLLQESSLFESHHQKSSVSLSPSIEYLLYDKWDRVCKIEYVRTDTYYDMEVPLSHNYVAQGLIHHNTQWGKTCFEPDWLHREIVTHGDGDYIAGTATFPLLGLKMLPEFTSLFCDMLHWGKYHDSDKIIESHNGKSRIIFFSATNPESMESATAKAAVLDEVGQSQFRLQTWEAVQRRLSLNQGRCLFGTTLYSLGWLKTEVYDKALAGDTLFEIIHGDSIDNPCFPRDEYERQRAQMPAWKFDMFYRGRYTRPVGLVYDCFSETDDVIDRFDIPKSWFIYSGHDFGSANPAAMFYAQDPATGLFFAFSEYLPGSRSTYEHVEAFKALTKGYNVIKRVGGNLTTEEGWRNDYTSHGWHIQPPKDNMRRVENQIAHVYALNKLHKVKVFRDLRHYLDQKISFSYVLDDKYQATDKYDNEAAMHLLASERYILSDFTPETVARQSSKVKIEFL